MLVNWSIYQMTSTLPFSYVHIPSPVARIDHGPWLLDQSCAELFDGIQQTPLETPLKDRFLDSPWKIKRIEQFSSSSHFHLVFFSGKSGLNHIKATYFQWKWDPRYQTLVFDIKPTYPTYFQWSQTWGWVLARKNRWPHSCRSIHWKIPPEQIADNYVYCIYYNILYHIILYYIYYVLLHI